MSIKSFFKPKKVSMSDIVSPKPSRAAQKALDRAMKKADEDQKAVSAKAALARG